MIDKRVETVEAALEGLGDGASIMVNGFGGTGVPFALIRALEGMTARNLTLILNGVRFVDGFAPGIFDGKRVSKVVVSAARSRGPDTSNYERQWLDGELEIEMVPQGTFAERMRAGGAGIPAFFTPTGAGTNLAAGKEERDFDGQPCILENALTADYALIRAARSLGQRAVSGHPGQFWPRHGHGGAGDGN
jgi:3-oxoacid CoA-transferase A subunit